MNKKSNCCGKCEFIDEVKLYCGNKDCPCHSPITESEECKHVPGFAGGVAYCKKCGLKYQTESEEIKAMCCNHCKGEYHCLCHTPSVTESEETTLRIEKQVGYHTDSISSANCGSVKNPPYSIPEEKDLVDWEKRFDKLSLNNSKIGDVHNQMKYFIKQELSSNTERVKKYALEMRDKVDKDEYCRNESNDWKNGYDCAMYDIINKLK